jgi:hypothetical protein
VCDRHEALFTSRDFVDAPLRVELLNGGPNIALRQSLDDGPQRGILLPDDLVETGRVDAGLLELVIRSASIDSLMLPYVPDEEHAVLGPETLQKRVHLLGARQAGFVQHVYVLLIAPRFFLGACEMPLQGAGVNTGFAELLCIASASWP